MEEGDDIEASAEFDKVAVCIGAWGEPKQPKIEESELFEGRIIHSQAFKQPEDFARNFLVVLGLGSTAADTATVYVNKASKIYLFHRRGANLIPRITDGKLNGCVTTRRIIAFNYFLNAILPSISEFFFNTVIKHLIDTSHEIDPQWRIHPPPSILTHQQTISDTLAACLKSGAITSTTGSRRFHRFPTQ